MHYIHFTLKCLFGNVFFTTSFYETHYLLLGAILNGIPGIVVTSIPAAVSAAWFPVHVSYILKRFKPQSLLIT